MKSASARTGSHQTMPCRAAYHAVPPRPTRGERERKRMLTQSREGSFIGPRVYARFCERVAVAEEDLVGSWGVDAVRPPSVATRLEEAGGKAPFEEWMRLALHDPEVGYYAKNVRTVGARGDFATASTLHPALGEAVAAWAAERRRALGGLLARWDLVELGPGSGVLAEAVLNSLPLLARRTVRLHLVETSPVLAAAQRARLGDRATWHATVGDALVACSGRAVVYASELLDAFPVQVLRRSGAGWQALWISLNEKEEEGEKRPGISSKVGLWLEEWRPASSELIGGAAPGAFSALSRVWLEGQRVEVAPAVRSLF